MIYDLKKVLDKIGIGGAEFHVNKIFEDLNDHLKELNIIKNNNQNSNNAENVENPIEIENNMFNTEK